VGAFVDLLRAVNVSGQNRLPMADLRIALAGAGFAPVETYVQSGNVVCGGPGEDEAAHAAAVHDVISVGFGLDVDVFAMTVERLEAAAAGNPFVGEDPAVDPKWLHVTFLSAPVEPDVFEALAVPATGDEAAVLSADGRLVYLRLPYGYGRTKLNNAWVERALRTRCTTRNWRTVLMLTELAGAQRSR
jgi:uncharacterized protein (DUF1697 family)